jgi:hypothetical protein
VTSRLGSEWQHDLMLGGSNQTAVALIEQGTMGRLFRQNRNHVLIEDAVR